MDVGSKVYAFVSSLHSVLPDSTFSVVVEASTVVSRHSTGKRFQIIFVSSYYEFKYPLSFTTRIATDILHTPTEKTFIHIITYSYDIYDLTVSFMFTFRTTFDHSTTVVYILSIEDTNAM